MEQLTGEYGRNPYKKGFQGSTRRNILLNWVGKVVLGLFVDFKSSLFTKENMGEKFHPAKRTIVVNMYIGFVIISVSTLDLIFF